MMRPDARNGGWCVFIETWEHFSRNWQWTASVIDLSKCRERTARRVPF
jgi:hypothetical protein